MIKANPLAFSCIMDLDVRVCFQIKDPHPARNFSECAAYLFCKRIVDVIEGRGDNTSLIGE